MRKGWTRRSLLAGAAALGPTLIVRPARAAEYRFAQYHNQAASGTLHKNLTGGLGGNQRPGRDYGLP
jgi:TRAP-type transport system periplasmic protein